MSHSANYFKLRLIGLSDTTHQSGNAGIPSTTPRNVPGLKKFTRIYIATTGTEKALENAKVLNIIYCAKTKKLNGY